MTTPLTDKLHLPEKLAYGCGDFASCLFWRTFMVYLPFFYTDVFGISAAALGTMLLVSRIWDGINENLDPAMAAVAVLLVLFTTLLLMADRALRRRSE